MNLRYAPSALRSRSAFLLLGLSLLALGRGACAAPAAPSSAVVASAAAAAQTDGGNSAMFRNRVPPEQIEQQADQQYALLIAAAAREKRLLGDKNKTVLRVRAIATKLIPYALKWNDRSRDWHWEINVIEARPIEALCLPGGKLVITTGMLERLHLSDNELAMLLGHEIAHGLREHARDHAQTDTPRSARSIARLFGLARIAGLNDTPPSDTAWLALAYTHDDEIEADVIGSEVAARAGYDPRAAISLWYKLDGVNRLARQPYVQTHPFDGRRIVDMQKHMRDMLALYARAVSKPISRLPAYQGVGYAASARRVEQLDNAD